MSAALAGGRGLVVIKIKVPVDAHQPDAAELVLGSGNRSHHQGAASAQQERPLTAGHKLAGRAAHVGDHRPDARPANDPGGRVAQ